MVATLETLVIPNFRRLQRSFWGLLAFPPTKTSSKTVSSTAHVIIPTVGRHLCIVAGADFFYITFSTHLTAKRSVVHPIILMWKFCLLSLALVVPQVTAQCLSDPELEEIFSGGEELPKEGSCCQNDICGLPCPEPVSKPTVGTSCDDVGPLVHLDVEAWCRVKMLTTRRMGETSPIRAECYVFYQDWPTVN